MVKRASSGEVKKLIMSVIILTEPKGYSAKAIRILKSLGPVYAWPQARKKPKILRFADVLVVKLGMQISKSVMDRLPNLKIIGTSTTGLNHIDMAEAVRRGIKIISLRGETKFLRTITPTAEVTIGLMIKLLRNLHVGYEGIMKERWWKEKCYGYELTGKTLGVLGFGRLGSIVARSARVLGMDVIACDPFVSAAAIRRAGAKKVSMEEVFRRSDVVSNHVLHTPATTNLVKHRHFRMMRPTAYYINTARGELNDEQALLKALQKKWIAGAALDVLACEDPKGRHVIGHPLVRYAQRRKNLIILPHLGGATFESMAKTEEFITERIVREIKKLRN